MLHFLTVFLLSSNYIYIKNVPKDNLHVCVNMSFTALAFQIKSPPQLTKYIPTQFASSEDILMHDVSPKQDSSTNVFIAATPSHYVQGCIGKLVLYDHAIPQIKVIQGLHQSNIVKDEL